MTTPTLPDYKWLRSTGGPAPEFGGARVSGCRRRPATPLTARRPLRDMNASEPGEALRRTPRGLPPRKLLPHPERLHRFPASQNNSLMFTYRPRGRSPLPIPDVAGAGGREIIRNTGRHVGGVCKGALLQSPRASGDRGGGYRGPPTTAGDRIGSSDG
jgi:hypothetical protein